MTLRRLEKGIGRGLLFLGVVFFALNAVMHPLFHRRTEAAPIARPVTAATTIGGMDHCLPELAIDCPICSGRFLQAEVPTLLELRPEPSALCVVLRPSPEEPARFPVRLLPRAPPRS